MKKALFLCAVLAVCACQKQPSPETPPADENLTGVSVSTEGFPEARKIFLLNEGQMGAGNATLDFLRLKDSRFIRGAFAKMNPDVAGGLGDVGNDIAVKGDEVWMVINNSGIVEVVSARDEKEIAAIAVPSPRSIAFDDRYAYVTSWAGAFATYGEGYTVTDSANPKGRVYRIDLGSKKVAGSVEVGYQPEGIACHDGKLYVANSGGISSQLAPNYAYDNTLSVIDTKTFTVTRSVEVQVNLKNVYADAMGNIYATALGDYYSVHSGLYMLDREGVVKHISDHVSLCAQSGDTIYCIGTADEWEWDPAFKKTYSSFSCTGGVKGTWDFTPELAVPYGLAVLAPGLYLVCDAGDYVNPGSLHCYDGPVRRWSVTTGVSPARFAIW